MATLPSLPAGKVQNTAAADLKDRQTAPSSQKGLKVLITALRALDENDCFQELAATLKEAETLREQLDLKDDAIKQLQQDNEKIKDTLVSTTELLTDKHRKKCAEIEAQRDGSVKETSALRESLRQKDESCKSLEEQRSRMQTEVSKLKDELKSSSNYVRDERQRYITLEQDCKLAKSELERLKTQLNRRESEASELREAKVSLEKGKEGMRQSLLLKSQELKRLQTLAGDLIKEPLETTRERLENLWREAQFMVNKHFRFKLSDAAEQGIELAKRLRASTGALNYDLNQVIPLPRRDSLAAMNMRCAFILAMLMRSIDIHVFQPNYLDPWDSDIRIDLLQQAIKDSAGEAFRRAMLLSVLPERQEKILEDRTSKIAGEILGLVDGILPLDQVAGLKTDLLAFLTLASTTWCGIQRLQDRFETHMDYTIDDSIDWSVLPMESSGSQTDDAKSTASSGADEAALVIFPRMYIVKDAQSKPVTPGVVLMKSQTLAAAQEVRNETSKNPTIPKGPPNWSSPVSRRDSKVHASLASGSGAPFLGQGAPNGPLR